MRGFAAEGAAARHHRESNGLRGLQDDEWKCIGITEPAQDLIRLTMAHFAQHGEHPGIGGEVIEVIAINALDPAAIIQGSGVTNTYCYGHDAQARRKQHGPDSSLTRSVRAVLQP